MNILMTGSSGLIGSALGPALTEAGHHVIRLLRRPTSPDTFYWQPEKGVISPDVLTDLDAVIHLAGESIGDRRWTRDRKHHILQSRVTATRLLAEHLARLEKKPAVFISASGAGIYGDCGDAWVDETSEAGHTFLAEVGRQWEAATTPAADAGIRVVWIRLGVVLSTNGGALSRMLLPFKLGLGGKLGHGRQYMSWVSLSDVVSIIQFILMQPELRGPVNVVAPKPVTNLEFTKTLGQILHRPTPWWVPAAMLRLLFGEMADELLLTSTRVRPQKLLDRAVEFQHPHLNEALEEILGR